MEQIPHRISETTEISLPIKTLITLITFACISVWAYFGIIERLNKAETNQILFQTEITKNSEFRIRWPRGELGSLPADMRQDITIENHEKRLQIMEEQLAKMKEVTMYLKNKVENGK